MNEATLTALIQVGALATQTLMEYLRSPPSSPADAAAQGRATMALMDQAAAIGAALRTRLAANGAVADHVPEPDRFADVGNMVPCAPVPRPAPGNAAGGPSRALAATIWGEARGEDESGKAAVAWVARNRAADPGWWGKDVLSCCLSPAQFSCWWDKQGQAVRTVDEQDGQVPPVPADRGRGARRRPLRPDRRRPQADPDHRPAHLLPAGEKWRGGLGATCKRGLHVGGSCQGFLDSCPVRRRRTIRNDRRVGRAGDPAARGHTAGSCSQRHRSGDAPMIRISRRAAFVRCPKNEPKLPSDSFGQYTFCSFPFSRKSLFFLLFLVPPRGFEPRTY